MVFCALSRRFLKMKLEQISIKLVVNVWEVFQKTKLKLTSKLLASQFQPLFKDYLEFFGIYL